MDYKSQNLINSRVPYNVWPQYYCPESTLVNINDGHSKRSYMMSFLSNQNFKIGIFSQYFQELSFELFSSLKQSSIKIRVWRNYFLSTEDGKTPVSVSLKVFFNKNGASHCVAIDFHLHRKLSCLSIFFWLIIFFVDWKAIFDWLLLKIFSKSIIEIDRWIVL